MKNKIRFRLLLYFSGSLLAFSLIIGLIFFTTFSRYNMDVYKSELGNRAERMAQSLALFWSGDTGQPGHGMKGHSSGYGAYLRFLDDIAMTDVWIVDSNLRQITRSHGQPSLTYQDLPAEAEDVIAQAMDGKITFSENFGYLLGASPSISVAKRITLANGEVAGVILLHEKLENIRSTTQKSLVILLLSMGAAALISLFIAQRLAEHFTQPAGK
ncbi:MAG: PDC sensor domain-containing protein [Candidatus Syntrophopropionicum ammoniitolerans]